MATTNPNNSYLRASRASSNNFISIVVPAYNEEKNIPLLISTVNREMMTSGYPFELIIIDDGSSDDTCLAVTSSPYPTRLIKLSRNFGKENALTAGIELAQGDAVILMDADLQHPIHLIHDFLAAWRKGFEMVYGVRQHREDRSWFISKASSTFYKLLEKSTATSIPRGAGDFRLLDRKVVEAIRSLPERDRFMKGIFGWVGFSSHPIPFFPTNRAEGQSSFNFRSLFALAVTGVTSFSVLPLRIWTGIGAMISVCSILYATFIALRTAFFGTDVPGWATITISILFLGGIQLFSIGVLGEYLGRVFDEVKRRPKYIVAEDRMNTAQRNVSANLKAL